MSNIEKLKQLVGMVGKDPYEGMTMQEKKLARLGNMVKILDESLTKEEFIKAFSTILDFIKKLSEKNAQEFAFIRQKFDELSKKLVDSAIEDFDKLKKQTQDDFQKLSKKLDDKIVSIKDGQDGKDAVVDIPKIALEASKIASEAVQKQIPTTPQVIENILAQGDKIVEGLDLRIDDIKNLKKELDEIRKIKTQARIFGGGFNLGAMQLHILSWTEATGTPNDVLTDFVIGHSPNPISSLEVMVDNSMLFTGTNPLTDDWTYNPATHTISFLIAPPTGSKVRYKCLI